MSSARAGVAGTAGVIGAGVGSRVGEAAVELGNGVTALGDATAGVGEALGGNGEGVMLAGTTVGVAN